MNYLDCASVSSHLPTCITTMLFLPFLLHSLAFCPVSLHQQHVPRNPLIWALLHCLLCPSVLICVFLSASPCFVSPRCNRCLHPTHCAFLHFSFFNVSTCMSVGWLGNFNLTWLTTCNFFRLLVAYLPAFSFKKASPSVQVPSRMFFSSVRFWWLRACFYLLPE